MDSITTLVIQILLFIAVLFVAGYFLKRLATAGKFTHNKSKYMESIDRYFLSSDKWIEIIKIGQRFLILGVTPGGISEIKEIDQEDLHEIQTEINGNFFASILEKYTKK